jgi:hypothetical protein
MDRQMKNSIIYNLLLHFPIVFIASATGHVQDAAYHSDENAVAVVFTVREFHNRIVYNFVDYIQPAQQFHVDMHTISSTLTFTYFPARFVPSRH